MYGLEKKPKHGKNPSNWGLKGDHYIWTSSVLGFVSPSYHVLTWERSRTLPCNSWLGKSEAWGKFVHSRRPGPSSTRRHRWRPSGLSGSASSAVGCGGARAIETPEGSAMWKRMEANIPYIFAYVVKLLFWHVVGEKWISPPLSKSWSGAVRRWGRFWRLHNSDYLVIHDPVVADHDPRNVLPFPE